MRTGDPNAVADLDHELPEHLFFTFEDSDQMKDPRAAQQKVFEDEEHDCWPGYFMKSKIWVCRPVAGNFYSFS